MFGRKFKDVHAYVTWARLVAASGMVAITYTNIDPVADLRRLLTHLRDQSAHLGIDPQHVGLWACSGNVPNAPHAFDLAHDSTDTRLAIEAMLAFLSSHLNQPRRRS